MKNNRKYILFLVGILVTLLVIGITYAWLTQTVIGEKVHSMRVGTFKFSLCEENSLTLDSGEFLKDSDGLNQDGFKFSVENTGVGYGNYSVYLDDDTLSSNQTRIDDKFIRYSLGVNSDTVGTPTNLTSRKLYSGTLGSKEKDAFVLRVWLNKDVNGDIGGQVFKSKIRIEVDQTVPTPVAEKLLAGVGDKGTIDTSDSEQTFITGEDPNNYIWYSGKLWRAVSIDPTDNSVKLVTQWNIAAVSYNPTNNSTFKGSHMEQWLNDTSVDGFLGNLREPEKFIKTDSVWNATMTIDTSKIAKTTMVTDTVGLLNVYEYTMSYNGTTSKKGYLQNTDYWRLINPYDANNVWYVDVSSGTYYNNSNDTLGIRPSINLKPTVKIISGTGTLEDPYKVENDNPTGTLLSTRYSGEYISFGTGENNLYRIVSHENGLGTKIVSDSPIINTTIKFNNVIDNALNNTYLKTLTTEQLEMIEDNTTWYNSMVPKGDSYKLAKGTDTFVKKIGMLRYGELMTGQVDTNIHYWLLNGYDENNNWVMTPYGSYYYYNTSESYFSYKPAMNLKANVIITGGKGTRNEPFFVKLKN